MSQRRKIVLNGRFENDSKGYQKLASVSHALFSETERDVAFDCSQLTWFSGSMAGVLRAFMERFAAETERQCKFYGLSSNVLSYFVKCNLIGGMRRGVRGTVIPVKEFSTQQHGDFSRNTELSFRGKNVPKISSALKRKFFESMDEIYGNATLWSKTEYGVFTSGQFFPNEKHLDFSVVDMGRGFANSLLQDHNMKLSGPDAIEWATEESHTTRVGHVPGGIGLKIIREFIELNGGKLQIISHDGFYSYSRNKVIKRTLSPILPGTVLNLVIDTSDTNRYHLRGEVSPHDIF